MEQYVEKDQVRKMKDSDIVKRLFKYTKPFIGKFLLVILSYSFNMCSIIIFDEDVLWSILIVPCAGFGTSLP